MQEALARSVAETAADTLAARSAGAGIADEAIGLHLWFDRGFRDHDDLVTIINFTREILDQRERETRQAVTGPKIVSARAATSKPLQLSLDLGAM